MPKNTYPTLDVKVIVGRSVKMLRKEAGIS